MNERVLTAKEIRAFQRQIYRYYKFHRRDFPGDAQQILTVFLYQRLCSADPGNAGCRTNSGVYQGVSDFETLARASQKEVLLVWQGALVITGELFH
jgi:hypothetical protein